MSETQKYRFRVYVDAPLPGDPSNWIWVERVNLSMPRTTSKSYFEQNLKFLSQRKGTSSREFGTTLIKAIKAYPREIKFYMHLAQLMEDRKFYDLAERTHEHILSIDPFNKYSLLKMGRVIYYEKDRDAFAACARNIEKLFKDDDSNALLTFYYKTNNIVRATEVATNLLEREEGSREDRVRALGVRARCHLHAGAYELALKDAHSFMELNRDKAEHPRMLLVKLKSLFGISSKTKDLHKRRLCLSEAQHILRLSTQTDYFVHKYMQARLDHLQGNQSQALLKTRELIQDTDHPLNLVFYMLIAPKDDPFLKRLPSILGREVFDARKQQAEQWRVDGREPFIDNDLDDISDDRLSKNTAPSSVPNAAKTAVYRPSDKNRKPAGRKLER